MKTGTSKDLSQEDDDINQWKTLNQHPFEIDCDKEMAINIDRPEVPLSPQYNKEPS